MATTQEEVIMVEEDTIVEVDTRVDIRTILQEGQDARYATKKIILEHIVLIKIELT